MELKGRGLEFYPTSLFACFSVSARFCLGGSNINYDRNKTKVLGKTPFHLDSKLFSNTHDIKTIKASIQSHRPMSCPRSCQPSSYSSNIPCRSPLQRRRTFHTPVLRTLGMKIPFRPLRRPFRPCRCRCQGRSGEGRRNLDIRGGSGRVVEREYAKPKKAVQGGSRKREEKVGGGRSANGLEWTARGSKAEAVEVGNGQQRTESGTFFLNFTISSLWTPIDVRVVPWILDSSGLFLTRFRVREWRYGRESSSNEGQFEG